MKNEIYEAARGAGRFAKRIWHAYIRYTDAVTQKEIELNSFYNQERREAKHRGLGSILGL